MIASPPREQRALLLSVDFEDWHQLMHRRVGVSSPRAPGAVLARQTQALLSLFDELDARATFFVLGMSARGAPELVGEIAARGHEIACHGDQHRPVSAQTPAEFASDVARSCALIEELVGHPPRGYRAPAFSITRRTPWAFDVLADAGFAYDSSEHDSPRIRERMAPLSAAPHRIELAGGRSLWEFPIAVWRRPRFALPVGGASYWCLMPSALVLRGLRESAAPAGLYLHPQELDSRPLRALLPSAVPARQRLHAAVRVLQRELARRRAGDVLRAIAEHFQLIPYGEAHAQLSQCT
jgi:polysaccharide deacetylase family protein (PEP-CTERM system associated)